jgi:hypothetical protein
MILFLLLLWNKGMNRWPGMDRWLGMDGWIEMEGWMDWK